MGVFIFLVIVAIVVVLIVKHKNSDDVKERKAREEAAMNEFVEKMNIRDRRRSGDLQSLMRIQEHVEKGESCSTCSNNGRRACPWSEDYREQRPEWCERYE